jgi:hypothetical protein
MNRLVVLMLTFFTLKVVVAQSQPTQTIKGLVLDQASQTPLPGVAVKLDDGPGAKVVPTGLDGTFRFEAIAVGRHTLTFRFLGYQEKTMQNLDLNSAKELYVVAALSEQAVQGKEVVVTARVPKNQPINSMSTVSARTFSVEETQRYASSVNDVGRMAAGFAGVQPNKDNNNDVIIRGNSPTGVLWRLEGIEIPNPNHFARKGSTGGGISIISAQLLDNSDFSTGAFAAEYGNAFSGVFDLRFRKGNNERREYTFRAGILGLDFAAEGPFSKSKKGASYLFNYRYSTLGLLNMAGVYLVGPNVSNTFQDLCFNVAIPTEKAGQFTVFGVGGWSKEVQDVQGTDSTQWKSPLDYTRTTFTTLVGALGVTHSYVLTPRSYLKTVLMLGGNRVTFRDDTLTGALKAATISNEDYENLRRGLHTSYNLKANNHTTIKTGVLASSIGYSVAMQQRKPAEAVLSNVLQGNGNAWLLQPYAQIKHRIGAHLTLFAGLHSMWFTLNNSRSLEPRVSVKYDWGNMSITAAYGRHNQIQPLGNYFTQLVNASGQTAYPNQSLPFTLANHYVLAWDWMPTENFRVKLEPYYQQLQNVPIGAGPGSTYNLLNERDGYAKQALIPKGVVENRGVDLTLEKFFSQKFFFLACASVFDSRYKTNTGVWYNMRYNTRFTGSLLAGYEWALFGGKLEVGTRLVYMGGQFFSPVDVEASAKARTTVYDESQPFTLQMPNYARADLRLAWRISKNKRATQISIDVQNLTAHQNVWRQQYDLETKTVVYRYQSGLVPVLTYRIDF